LWLRQEDFEALAARTDLEELRLRECMFCGEWLERCAALPRLHTLRWSRAACRTWVPS
jgi:hypothetical protein